jgi:hypothetical protein
VEEPREPEEEAVYLAARRPTRSAPTAVPAVQPPVG